MSDYEDEEFENYDDDGFEGEEDDEDDYDVLPKNMSKAATPAPSTPKDLPSPQRGAGVRMSYTGNARPPSAGATFLPGKVSRTVDIPAFAGLTDAQRKTAMKKLAGAIKRKKMLKLVVVVMEDFPQLQSLSKYELYNMGRSQYAGVKVASSQTHEDDKEEEQQTDEIYCCTYSCQVPEDRNTAFEGEHTLSASGGAAATNSAAANPVNRAVMRIVAMAPDQESKLVSFMRWAGPVMLAALGMNPTARKVAIPPLGGADNGLSAGTLKLGRQQEALLAQRPVTGLAFCPGPSPLLLASYAPVGAQLGAAALLQDHSLGGKGMLCVWDLSSPTAPPLSVLVSEGSPSCCCWAPAPSTTLVFAGMEEGGVCAWDLEEPESRHPMEQVGGVNMSLRRPSYTTEYLADVATTAAPIVGIATTPRTDSRTRPCQIVSLNGWGTVTVYTAVLLAPADRNAADSDIGLRPGSRLKLVRTTQMSKLGKRTLWPLVGSKSKATPQVVPGEPVRLDQLVQTFSLQVLPGADMQLLVGSDAGKVLRGSLLGAPPAPKEYVPDDHKSPLAIQSNAPPLFVSGHSNGTVTLHCMHASPAVSVWPDVSRGKMLVVRWSPLRPTVFFALDSLCMLFTFDLTVSRSAPTAAQSFMLKSKQVASLPTYFDIAVVNQGDKSSGVPVFCIGYDDGLLDVNLLAQKQCTATENELRVLKEIVQENADAGSLPSGGQANGTAHITPPPKAGGKERKSKAR
ncbi:hypothetical protein VOLCADRAFT_94869 [Volvox carteri f. nagariensis]|uniref:Uncharacterized protein n=1 Tax=Volvox carteri f. nagariensis TaxID=3068 RepID=D8U5Z9_VOLCA|nr:uncharacterized protein VOLCADRAFT_94869 [Volvox carteri f. nagariensis]EFJ44849.1 hypothetical protein VOLCADRAFT_94869 [Volvox carteri f. nagariensis]|eukprot:XP_002954132.1 hypothetical protein VOLCADRAFT_94869 [Volvox carteri f. nagariensis]